MFRKAVQLQPGDAMRHFELGNALVGVGQLDEAVKCYEQAIRLKPGYAEAYHNLGSARVRRGQFEEAAGLYQKAIELAPGFGEAYNNLAGIFMTRGQFAEAVELYQRAIEVKPDYAEAFNNLGSAYLGLDRLDDAIGAYRKAIQLQPDFAQAYDNLSAALKDAGEIEEAVAAQRRAVELSPGEASIHSNLLYTLYFESRLGPEKLLEEHLRWARRYANPLKAQIRPHGNDRDPDRRLRLGYVSPDFREHPVGRLILPLLAGHDARQIEVYCYSGVRKTDGFTARMQSCAQVWREIGGMSDEMAAETIRGDRIDILVDLTAHMAGNRMLVFARKPAPVQVTYLAYPGTTGLEAIDYRITDRFLDPVGANENQYVEKSFRLERSYWCYEPPTANLEPSPLPALEMGHITFGCLNNFSKVSADAVETWSEILRGVPGSHLVLHALPGSQRDRMRADFGKRGIAGERLEFIGKLPLADYLRAYHRIDIGLDPFPYAGGTTTCDALWMGVPVVTLAGRSATARGGVSVLGNVGLPELIASSRSQYVEIAKALAGDLTKLGSTRLTMRTKMRNSALMDAAGFARDFEKAYRQIWRSWCLGQ